MDELGKALSVPVETDAVLVAIALLRNICNARVSSKRDSGTVSALRDPYRKALH